MCPVGDFWDHAPAHVAAVVAECGLEAVQLHGEEPPEHVTAMPRPVLKTIKMRDAGDLGQLDRYKPAAFLLDSPARWSEGEARRPISWTLAREASTRGRVILAAGLTPETVGEAIRVGRPWGVDVNSGVEAAPGRTDPEKVARFVRAAAVTFESTRGYFGANAFVSGNPVRPEFLETVDLLTGTGADEQSSTARVLIVAVPGAPGVQV